MRLLLDTHIAIWAVAGAPELSPEARALIEDPANDVAVSIVSLWEIAIKNSLRGGGRAPIGVSVQAAADAFAAASFDLRSFHVDVLRTLESLPRLHGDPFDRLLVATATTETYRLMTHDKALAAYGDHVLPV